jgi:alpha-L-fucosidase 2
MLFLTRAVVAAWLLASGATIAAAADCLPVTPTQPDGNYIIPGVRGGIVYRRVGGRNLALDGWVPPTASGRPAVIVIHGGGYTTGSRIAYVGQLLELMTAARVPWFSVDYRLNGPAAHAASADDVRSAVEFVRCHAQEFGIANARIVLLGEDSGAAIALDLARDSSARVAGAILVGGAYGADGAGERDETAPGAQGPRPSLLFVHGTADSEQPIDVAQSRCAQWRATGGGCTLIPVDDGIHRAENWRPSQWGYKRQVLDWLRRLSRDPGETGSEALPTTSLAGTLSPGLHKRVLWDPEHSLTLDAWIPEAGSPTAIALLVHGGGWEAGDRVTYVTPLFEPLARAGIAWASIDYRLTPEVQHASQVDDLRRAVAYLRAHAQEFNIDPSRLVLVGESASGQMAALLAAEDRALAGVVSLYGVYDFEPMVSDASPRSLAARLFGLDALDDAGRGTLREYSPLRRAVRGMPPILLIHGTNERLWDQGVAYAARLRELGVPHELLRLDGAPHGMENWEGHSEWMAYKKRIVDWIRRRGAQGARVAPGATP